MAKRRGKDRDLPARVYRKDGSYWHVAQNKWTKLARLDDWGGMLARYAELEGTEDPHTLAGAIAKYRREDLPDLAKQTQRDYSRALDLLAEWGGHLLLSYIQPTHVARLLNDYPSSTEANRVAAVLSSVYRRAIRWGWVEVNPCLGVPRNPAKRRKYVPPWDELRGLRAALDPHTAAALDLALLTGLRLGDMLALHRSDLTGSTLRARISKTDTSTLYKLTPALAATLDRLSEGRESEWLVPNRAGKRYTVSGWESLWQRKKRAAGYSHIRWHDLRARALTDAARSRGRDYAQAIGAHADGSTTEIYIRGRDEAAIDPLPAPFS